MVAIPRNNADVRLLAQFICDRDIDNSEQHLLVDEKI